MTKLVLTPDVIFPDLARSKLVSLSCNMSNRALPPVFSKIAKAKIGNNSETAKYLLIFSYHGLYLIMLQTTIAILQAEDNVIDHAAYCILRTAVCR